MERGGKVRSNGNGNSNQEEYPSENTRDREHEGNCPIPIQTATAANNLGDPSFYGTMGMDSLAFYGGQMAHAMLPGNLPPVGNYRILPQQHPGLPDAMAFPPFNINEQFYQAYYNKRMLVPVGFPAFPTFTPVVNSSSTASAHNDSRGSYFEEADHHIDQIWNFMFSIVLQFGIQHEHYNIPKDYVISFPDGGSIRIGEWMYEQQELRRTGNLSPEKLARLDGLVASGKLHWDDQHPGHENAITWNRYLRALYDFISKHGHGNVPKLREVTLQDGVTLKLGLWLEMQRNSKREGKLPPDREFCLQELVNEGKLSWNPISNTTIDREEIIKGKDRWLMFYEALLRYGNKILSI